MIIKQVVNKIHTLILLILAAGAPILVVVPEQYWFEKRVALTGAGVVLLAVLAARVWTRGQATARVATTDTGWLVFAAALVVAGLVPAGRISNLIAPELWVGLSAIVAHFAIRNTTSSRMIKLGFFAAVVGVVVAVALVVAGLVPTPAIGRPQGSQLQETLETVKRFPIFGEFREFRAARLGILQVASGLGILGILGTLAVVYQLGLKSVKGVFKSGSLWWRLLNILVLVLLVGFLVLPHPALMLWPLAIVAALSCGIAPISADDGQDKHRIVWAGFVGLLIVAVLGSSFGLGKVVWGELKFREALAAANRNEGITTYYALLEAIERNPYEVRYRLLASQIDIALANSIAVNATTREAEAGGSNLPAGKAGVEAGNEGGSSKLEESTPSAGLTPQDQNNILILIQQAVVQGKEAIKLDPNNPYLWQNLASIYRGLVGVAGGAEDWALKSYQRAAELNPKDPSSWIGVGEIHFFSGNFQGAADAFLEATRASPDFARAHYNLAVAYNALGEPDRAIEALERVLEILPKDSEDREQVEKDLEFLEAGSSKVEAGKEGGSLKLEEEATPSAELKEATSSAEVQPPPPPVGPEEATESAETKPIEVR